MKSKELTYEGKAATVTYDLARCIHAGECVRGLPEVFDPDKRPWVQPDNAPADQLAAVIERCPTGALRMKGSQETAGPGHVKVIPDGPLYVRGNVIVDRGDGSEALRETRIALCRCGASMNKPLCDNAHGEAGFSDAGSILDSKMKDEDVESDSLRVTVAKNGPLLCEGALTLEGTNTSVTGARVAFCRCGASLNKPFCDGSHREIGFTG